MRVLLVEDNPDDTLIIQEMLSATAVEIEHASSLSLALEKLTRGDFDLILLDLSLPDARGPGMIGLVRNQSPGIPIVVLSGMSDENAAIQTMDQGAQDYLTKAKSTPNYCGVLFVMPFNAKRWKSASTSAIGSCSCSNGLARLFSGLLI